MFLKSRKSSSQLSLKRNSSGGDLAEVEVSLELLDTLLKRYSNSREEKAFLDCSKGSLYFLFALAFRRLSVALFHRLLFSISSLLFHFHNRGAVL